MSPPAMLGPDLHLRDLAVRDQAWIPAGSPIRRSFDVRDLRSALARTPVGGVILVQVINDADETTDFIDCARNVDTVPGVVRWADLTSPDFAAALCILTSAGCPVGIRHQALAEADHGGLAAIAQGPAQPRGTRGRRAAVRPGDPPGPVPGSPGSGAGQSRPAVRA